MNCSLHAVKYLVIMWGVLSAFLAPLVVMEYRTTQRKIADEPVKIGTLHQRLARLGAELRQATGEEPVPPSPPTILLPPGVQRP